ncbi:hypothetical protein SAMN05660845_0784 [Flavobacterium swingsii]|jgi:hypothetical protein|uniref:Uncharacterized protein n=1 Tax=Flavobacterium swingsii TaxID=498292 RepID=A0A1I0WJI3_9FLAO|nr:hypothetical protein [Flavobacterium swingsii]SFA88096.1 hypothetical protein SAMN05660845_0784 [Flavobacterium swingsii]
MKINPKTGIDQLIFGMKQKDVTAIYGNPDKQYKDEESNVIFLYNDKKLRLTFYEDENLKLGYMISSNPDLELFSEQIIGKQIDEVEKNITNKGIKSLEIENFDTVDNYFNESNWMIFQVEYKEVIRFELGATINDKDEFDWKFKG